MRVHFIRVNDTMSICQQFHDAKFMELQCVINNNVDKSNVRLIPEDLYIYRRTSKSDNGSSKRVIAYKAPDNACIIYIISGKLVNRLCNTLGDQEELVHLMNELSFEATLK